MRPAPPSHRLCLLVLLLATPSCQRPDGAATDGDAPTARADGAADATDPTAAEAVTDSAATVPEEIYHDLTEFAWYRQGRPLLHGGRGHLPAGPPVRIPGGEEADEAAELLQPAGDYEGVRYYRRPSGGDTLFVPVFPHYWLPFAPAG